MGQSQRACSYQCTLLHMQIDTECDFGYKWDFHNGTLGCKPIPGFDVNTCPHVRDRSYVISKSGLRLLNGDSCANVSRVINDTDGRGHSTLPEGKHFPRWVVVTLILLVSCVSMPLAPH